MSTWVSEVKLTWAQKLCVTVLKHGPLPKHVGFILDGNRRYAKERKLHPIDGHIKGFEKLTETLKWCLEIGIGAVTLYIFSIENFKRPKKEVDGLMMLLKEKFELLLEEIDKINEEGICIQLIGDWSLVPSDLKPLMAKAMIMTKRNTKLKLNLAFAYTARNEMARAANSLVNGVTKGELLLQDLSEELFEDTFQFHPSTPLDLLVRTSGETRLSDFLLWQSSETVVCFTPGLWPDFTLWRLLNVVFQYQLDYFFLAKMKMENSLDTLCAYTERRTKDFSDGIRNEKWNVLNLDSNSA